MKCLESGILIFIVYTRMWVSRFLTIPLNTIKSGIRLITRILKSLWKQTAMLLSLRTHTPSTVKQAGLILQHRWHFLNKTLMGECSKGTHAGDINVNTSIIALHAVKCYWKFSPVPRFANLLRSPFEFLSFFLIYIHIYIKLYTRAQTPGELTFTSGYIMHTLALSFQYAHSTIQ